MTDLKSSANFSYLKAIVSVERTDIQRTVRTYDLYHERQDMPRI